MFYFITKNRIEGSAKLSPSLIGPASRDLTLPDEGKNKSSVYNPSQFLTSAHLARWVNTKT
jgi:hypothetical protein